MSEYDQEIPQSQTADNPWATRGRATQPSRDTGIPFISLQIRPVIRKIVIYEHIQIQAFIYTSVICSLTVLFIVFLVIGK